MAPILEQHILLRDQSLPASRAEKPPIPSPWFNAAAASAEDRAPHLWQQQQRQQQPQHQQQQQQQQQQHEQHEQLQPKFMVLETLRGLAALSITIDHLGGCYVVAWDPGQGPPLYLGVDFFLVLSGFVLSHSYFLSGKVFTPVQLFGYRVARLWPMTAFALVASLVVTYCVKPPENARATKLADIVSYASQMLMFNPGGNIPNPASWTVTWEFWIVVALAFTIRGDVPGGVLLLCGALGQLFLLLMAGNLGVYLQNYFHVINAGCVRCTSAFLLGMLAYKMYLGLPRVRNAFVSTSVELALSVAVVIVNCGPCKYSDFAAPWLFMLTVVCFAREEGLLSWLLRWCRFLGTISFSVYINHWMVLLAMQRLGLLKSGDGLSLRNVLLFWLLLFPYSCLTYFLVEMPLMRLMRRQWDMVLLQCELFLQCELLPPRQSMASNWALLKMHDLGTAVVRPYPSGLLQPGPPSVPLLPVGSSSPSLPGHMHMDML